MGYRFFIKKAGRRQVALASLCWGEWQVVSKRCCVFNVIKALRPAQEIENYKINLMIFTTGDWKNMKQGNKKGERDQVERRAESRLFGVSLCGWCSLSQVENESGRQGGLKAYNAVTLGF